MPDLVVIMSVYRKDKLKFVAESVQSILNQTFTKFDYYIVFDGPVLSDIDSYISSLDDNRIKLYRHDKNEGLAVALNCLLKLIIANPEYKFIARMDADDISFPSRLEKQRNFLLGNPYVSCVGCWYEEIDELGNHLTNKRLPCEHEALKKRYFTRTPFAHPSVMYRRQLIEQAGFYPTDTILMEDNILWGLALLQGLKFGNLPEYLFKFRIDRDFYKRRSGFIYGLSYLKMKIRMNRKLNAPLHYEIFLICIGIVKMFPFFFLKHLYNFSD